MKRNLENFADLLSFDIFYGIIKGDEYHVGLFTVNDEEMCVRIVGVAFFKE